MRVVKRLTKQGCVIGLTLLNRVASFCSRSLRGRKSDFRHSQERGNHTVSDRGRRPRLQISTLALLTFPVQQLVAQDTTEFFEMRIRPILAQECYECHSEATKAKAGLLLDSRAGWEKGGDSGKVIIPGEPAESLLLKTISHEIEDQKMPKAGAKLDENVIEDLR